MPSPQEAHRGYRVQMQTRQWLTVDAVLDNEAATQAVQGDPRGVVEFARSIRRAGWDQIPDWPRDARGFETWPAPGQQSTVTLDRDQWELVLSALEQWASVAEQDRADPEAAENARFNRAIAHVIRAELGRQGWVPSTAR
ncbi:hypothetical protein [Spirillospora sp. NPDC029432]|uniref:hypothetical protein n=1 Tax=Spirillospora sp. NPDC029432 TaxID=3154599 RepID=UPI0034513285